MVHAPNGHRLRSILFAGALAGLGGCGGDQNPAPTRSVDRAPEDAPSPAASSPQPSLPGFGPGDATLMAQLDAARVARGPDYVPRTHHLLTDGAPRYTNRLILESSPYLLQHAHNPVNWYPWGDEAFARARREDKPVLMSIGYSTCHWCHVMERESFEDEEIAAYINANFVAIKVDREARPDVDDVYMAAVQRMTGRGGWPMTIIMTPDRLPYFAGTYFPARTGDRGSRRGFFTILQEMKAAWDTQDQAVLMASQEVSLAIAMANAPAPGAGMPDARAIQQAAKRSLAGLDRRWGGFGRAPKFPRPANLGLLLQFGRRAGSTDAVKAVQLTLTRMIEGGVHDHVGGGFHRYSVDATWLVPHFEKMLYDNAQLVVALLETGQATGDARLQATAAETLDYLDREMRAPSGGFFSATDADSRDPDTGEEEEGWFFTWTHAELDAALSPATSRAMKAMYETRPRGNFEGRNILHTRRSAAEVAASLGMTEVALERSLVEARRRLYEVRAERPPPLRDDKIIAAWNGLALSAFSRGSLVLNDSRYLARARALATFVLDHMRDDRGRLRRIYHEGRARHHAVLEDYAFVIQGLLDLAEADSDLRWVREALTLQALQERHYADAGADYFASADDGEQLLVRPKSDYDGAEPSGNSIAARNLLRLHALTGDDAYRRRADEVFRTQGLTMRRRGMAVPAMLSALDFRLDRAREVFIISPETPDDGAAALEQVLRETYVPNRVVVRLKASQVEAARSVLPPVEGKIARGGRTTAYVCELGVCEAPTSDPSEFRAQLAAVTPYARAGG